MRLVRCLPIFAALAVLVSFVLAAPPVYAQAQATSGDIEGTVRDQDGQVLPGVSITVTNDDTGRTRTAVTNAEGYYRVPLLPPGSYTVRAELEGFQTVDRTGVTLRIGSVVEVNVDMPLATVEEVLIVTGQAPIVETSKSHVGTNIDEDSIDSLPILGRDFSDFTLLTPGATLDPDRGTVSISGQRGVNTSVNIDGTSSNSAFFGYQRGGTDAPFTISLESVREFEVITSGIMPEFGRSGGGLVNVVTKSGTNQWRGGGHLFLRDEALTGKDAFDREQEEFSVQQFGGHVGGPLVRNETFLFASTDFQKFETPFFVEWDITDAQLAAINALAESELDITLQPGRHIKTNDAQVYFVKMDHALSEDHSLSVRWNFSYHETENGAAFDPSGTTNFDVSSEGTQDELTNSIVAQITSVLGDNAYNEFRVQYAQDDLDRNSNAPGTPQTTIFQGNVNFGKAFFHPINVREDKWQVQDNFSYLFGSHDIKAGFDIETDDTAEFFAGFNDGWYFFGGINNFLNSDPLFMLQFFGNTEFPNFLARQTMAAAYVQDSWKVTPELTLNYGVRWEGTFNPTPPNPNPEIPETAQIPDDLNNWQPRVGLAYSPDERTVVRASAGLFYSRSPTLLFFNPYNSNGLPNTGVFFFPGFLIDGLWPNTFDSPAGFPPEQEIFWFDPGFEEAQTLRTNVGVEREIFEDFSVGASVVYADVKNLQRLYDRNLAFGFIDDTGRLVYANDGDDPIRPVPGEQHRVDVDDGFGDYKALILDFKKRFSGGYGFFGSYTLAEDRDNDSNERSAGGEQPTDIFNPETDLGPSLRDIKHRFVVSGFVELPYGFRASGIFVGRSGTPFSAVLDGIDANFDGDDANDRAVDPTTGRVFPRNSFRQPNFFNTDVRVTKQFDVGRAGRLEVLLEVFNLFANENKFITGSRQNFLSSQFDVPNSFIGNVRQAQIGFRFTY